MELKVRQARPSDWIAIEMLHQISQRSMPRLWQWEAHLSDRLFSVVTQSSRVRGGLFACPDDAPVAWVRLAVLDDRLQINDWLDLSLPPLLDELRRRGVRCLSWMDFTGWVESALPSYGFRILTRVITLTLCQQDVAVVPVDVRLRRATEEDIEDVARLDHVAFPSHWWQSQDTMRQRLAVSSHFVVAEAEDKVVGYAESSLTKQVAHLNRIAVHPRHQGHGIGSALLCDMIRSCRQSGAHTITLNTQIDNVRSRRLYQRFGFEPTGESICVWDLMLCDTTDLTSSPC